MAERVSISMDLDVDAPHETMHKSTLPEGIYIQFYVNFTQQKCSRIGCTLYKLLWNLGLDVDLITNT